VLIEEEKRERRREEGREEGGGRRRDAYALRLERGWGLSDHFLIHKDHSTLSFKA
jgi:hypothetical protein